MKIRTSKTSILLAGAAFIFAACYGTANANPDFIGKAPPCTFEETRTDFANRPVNCYGNPLVIVWEVGEGDQRKDQNVEMAPEPTVEPPEPPDKEPPKDDNGENDKHY